MLGCVMAVTCYLPNSSYSYNPLSRQGTLQATFMFPDDSDAYEVCQSLDGHLVQAKIVLALEDGATDSSTDISSSYATSSNYYFQVGAPISVIVSIRSDRAHLRALQTQQTNFIIEILDMDAVIEQTLSLYAVQSYNYDECFSNIQFYLLENTMQLEASVLDCDLNSTVFAGQIESDFLDDQLVISAVIVTGIGEMQIGAARSLREAYTGTDNQLSIVYNCTALLDSNPAVGAMCERIFQYMMQYPNYECKFECRAQTLSRKLQVEMQAYIASISMRIMDGCFSSTYVINSDFILVRFSISEEDRCMPKQADFTVQLVGNLQQFDQTFAGLNYMFTADYDTELDQRKVSMECRLQDDPERCRQMLTSFTNMDASIFRLRLYFHYPNGDYEFMGATSIRADYCFAEVEAELFVDSHNSQSGGVRIATRWTENQNCRHNVEVRTLLQCDFELLTQPGGRIDLTNGDPVLSFSTRETFSDANTTLLFACADCRQQLKTVAKAIREKQVYGYVIIEQQRIPIALYYDKIIDTNPAIYAGAACAMGLVCGIGGFLASFPAWCSCKKRHAKVAALKQPSQ